jgi:hypothetical protein
MSTASRETAKRVWSEKVSRMRDLAFSALRESLEIVN